jgi:AcrR family transcriptional regulator
MMIPRQQSQSDAVRDKGPSARTRRLIVDTAIEMMREGASPSVSDVAEVAEVSRSTAYRYFPTRAAMVQAVIVGALGPILEWDSDQTAPDDRIASLFASSFPRLLENEVVFRAALRQSLEQPDNPTPEHPTSEHPDWQLGRGHRMELLTRALTGPQSRLPEGARTRLAQALSMTFGVESIIVLKDIWGLDNAGVQSVTLWAARAMIKAALDELPA